MNQSYFSCALAEASHTHTQHAIVCIRAYISHATNTQKSMFAFNSLHMRSNKARWGVYTIPQGQTRTLLVRPGTNVLHLKHVSPHVLGICVHICMTIAALAFNCILWYGASSSRYLRRQSNVQPNTLSRILRPVQCICFCCLVTGNSITTSPALSQSRSDNTVHCSASMRVRVCVCVVNLRSRRCACERVHAPAHVVACARLQTFG